MVNLYKYRQTVLCSYTIDIRYVGDKLENDGKCGIIHCDGVCPQFYITERAFYEKYKIYCFDLSSGNVFRTLRLRKVGEKDEIAVPILETKDITYKTVKAEIGDISQEYHQEGVYDYPYSETVTFKASGQIKSIDVESPCDVKRVTCFAHFILTMWTNR